MPLIESFAFAVSLASTFSGGRNVKNNVELLEFLAQILKSAFSKARLKWMEPILLATLNLQIIEWQAPKN